MSKTDQKTNGEEPGESPPNGVELDDKILLGDRAQALVARAAGVGVVSLGIAAVLGANQGDHFQHFFHSYLVAFTWVLAIVLGALWWVTLQHLVAAKWSIVVRRMGELFSATMPFVVVFALPILADMLSGHSQLYIWLDENKVHANHLLHHKVGYLNISFFLIRFAIYFGFWSLLARFYLKSSLAQDASGKPELVASMRKVSAPSMIAIALTLTFAAFDFLMSLEPTWYSTIFGVYYFAGCVLGVHAALILALMWVQRNGCLVKSVTVEHYHDLGKMMFAFIIFWSYIAFSQFMLIYYANIPEETFWYKERFQGGWANVSWALLFCHFVIPFFGLLSRHVKRHRGALAVGAVWVLLIEYLDLYWLVVPKLYPEGPAFGLIDLACWVGLASLLIAAVAYNARKVNLVPIRDPRLKQSLLFENI